MSQIKLYNKVECPFCWKVRLALAEAGIDVELIDHEAPETRDEWQALTPRKTVPILVDGETVIFESNVILEYVDEISDKLLPESPQERVLPRLINQYSDAVIGVGLREVIFEKRGKPESEWDRARIQGGIDEFEKALGYLAEILGDRDYFGTQYSLPECALTARFGLAGGYGVTIPERYPNLIDWFARMQARPSYQITAPQNLKIA